MADDVIEIRTNGLQQMHATLQLVPIAMERKLVRGGMRGALKNVVLPAVRAAIHPVSGELAAGLRVGTRVINGRVVAYIRVKGKHAYVGKWLEWGTKSHYIKVHSDNLRINVRRSIRLGKIVRESMTTLNRRVLRIGTQIVGPVVHHPGARAKSFLRAPFDATAVAAVLWFGRYVNERLEAQGLRGPDEPDVEEA